MAERIRISTIPGDAVLSVRTLFGTALLRATKWTVSGNVSKLESPGSLVVGPNYASAEVSTL